MTKTISYPAEYETITEPVYEEMERAICNGCGADITTDPNTHMKSQLLLGVRGCGAWHAEWTQVQTGVTTKKVVTKEAWTETVKVAAGQKCSECGATK